MSPLRLELAILVGTIHVYAFVLVLGAAIRKSRFLSDETFSRLKFYTLLGWVPLTFIALAFTRGASFMVFFVVAGLLGIVAEVLVSLVWRAFFSEPIWSYSYGAIARGFTSTLNFLPWAMGGLLFHVTSSLLPGNPIDATIAQKAALIAGMTLAIGFAIAWPLKRFTSARHGVFSKSAFALFCMPIVASAICLSTLSSPRYLLAMAAFSVVGFATEYGYGRSMRIFFERGLWTYHPWKIDGGHSSYVTFPLWSVGGLFFHFVARAVGL